MRHYRERSGGKEQRNIALIYARHYFNFPSLLKIGEEHDVPFSLFEC